MKFNELVAQKFPKLKKQISEVQEEDDILRTLYYYRKEFGMTYEQLMDEPLFSFFTFMEQINKENERQRKEADKAKRKRK